MMAQALACILGPKQQFFQDSRVDGARIKQSLADESNKCCAGVGLCAGGLGWIEFDVCERGVL